MVGPSLNVPVCGSEIRFHNQDKFSFESIDLQYWASYYAFVATKCGRRN